MKKIFSIALITIFSLCMFASCSSKQDPINDLEDLSVELDENSKNYTQSDWEQVAKKYAQIEKDMQQYEYSDEELKEIGKLKAKCIGAVARSSVNIMKSQMHNLQMEFEGASEELKSTFDELSKEFEDSLSM